MAKKILIVDDEPDILMITEIRLKASGYEILTAADGREALEAAEKQKPDLILLDLSMPEIDGCEVAKRIKTNEALKHIPIIFFAATSVDIAGKVEECQADDYCLKPFDSEELLKKLKKLLYNKRC